MKYLIILILLTMSCTDKKQIAEPIIAEVPKPEPIKLSYENDLDLMLVDTRFEIWDWELSELRKDPTVFDDDGESHGSYDVTYWDTNTHTYYVTTNDVDGLDPITNIQFEYTIDEQKQYEAVFHPSMKEIFRDTKAPLLYIGSISPLERVYLDPTNQVYYIKRLTHFDTSTYTIYEYPATITNTNSLPIFPFYDTNVSYNTRYTNSQGDMFYGIDVFNIMDKVKK